MSVDLPCQALDLDTRHSGALVLPGLAPQGTARLWSCQALDFEAQRSFGSKMAAHSANRRGRGVTLVTELIC